MAHNLINFFSKRPLSYLRVGQTEHYPVMHREVHAFVQDYLDHRESRSELSKPTYQMLDCTFGGGNHSVPLLSKHKNLRVLGLDLDMKVMSECRTAYQQLIKEKRLALEHTNFVHAQHVDARQAFGKKIGVT